MHRIVQRRKRHVFYLCLIAFGSINVRLLAAVDLENSALLYVLLPFTGALLIAALQPNLSGQAWWHSYAQHTASALIVFLGSSIVLFEGFLCVLFFMPIYFIGVGIAWFCGFLIARAEHRRSRLMASLIPLIVLLLSLEGTSSSLSFARDNQVAVELETTLTPAQVMANLQRPINLQTDRHWLLALFPMPEPTSGHPLTPGHLEHVTVHYQRWFITNEHTGVLTLKVASASDRSCTVEVIDDTTLFAGYLDLEQFQVAANPTATGSVVTLGIRFRRKLDPAWYFGPITRFAIERTAELLMREVILRG